MNEVLGSSAGNALEISESLAYLKNEKREPRLDEVVLSLVSEMLLVGGISDDRASARERCEEAISSGRAVEVFARMVSMLGGPSDFIENADTYLPQASVIRPVYAEGFVSGVNGRAVGNAIIELGGGRREVGERLDLSVGFSEVAAVGTALNKDNPVAVIHAASDDDAKRAEKNLRAAISLSAEAPPAQRPVIIRTLTAADTCAVS